MTAKEIELVLERTEDKARKLRDELQKMDADIQELRDLLKERQKRYET